MANRTLIKGGTVITVDRSLGDFPEADVLVEDGKIAAVGPAVDAGAAQGRRADVILIRADTFGMTPLNNPVGA